MDQLSGLVCTRNISPFSNESKKKLSLLNNSDHMFNFDETNSKLALFPSQNNETMYHKFNDFISLQNTTTDNSGIAQWFEHSDS